MAGPRKQAHRNPGRSTATREIAREMGVKSSGPERGVVHGIPCDAAIPRPKRDIANGEAVRENE